MSVGRLTAQQLLESIEKGFDDLASDSDDSIELRYETEDEEEKEVDNDIDQLVFVAFTQTKRSGQLDVRSDIEFHDRKDHDRCLT